MNTYPKMTFVVPSLKVSDPGEMKADRGVLDWQGTKMGSLHMTPVRDIWTVQDKIVIDYGEDSEPKEVMFQDMSRGRYFTLDRAEALVPELRTEVGLPPASPADDERHFAKISQEAIPLAPKTLKNATTTIWIGAALMAFSVLVVIWVSANGSFPVLSIAGFFFGLAAVARGIDSYRQGRQMAAGTWRPRPGIHGWQNVLGLSIFAVLVIAAIVLIVVAANSQ